MWSQLDTVGTVAGDPVALVRGDVEDEGDDDLRSNLFVAGGGGRFCEPYWNGSAWSWVDAGQAVAF